MSRKIFLIVIVLTFALLYAGSRIQVIQLGYDVSKLKSQVTEMSRSNSLLRSKVAQAGSTARLAEAAKRLGMASPEASQVIFLDEKGE